MDILIDYREQAIKTILDDNLVTYMNLQIGDIQIIQDNPEKTPIIVLKKNYSRPSTFFKRWSLFGTEKKNECF